MYFKKINMIFIHIPKNAGTSIEESIWEYYGDELPSIIKKLIKMSKAPIVCDVLVKKKLYENKIAEIVSTFFIKFYHKTILDYKADISKNNPITFTVVRHPQNRLISLYKYMQFYKYISFEEFLKKFVLNCKSHNFSSRFTTTQVSFLCNETGNLDERIHILRYETLDLDWYNFCKKYDIKCYKLVYENKSVTNKSVDVIWTDEMRKIVYDKYKDDFTTFGYNIY